MLKKQEDLLFLIIGHFFGIFTPQVFLMGVALMEEFYFNGIVEVCGIGFGVRAGEDTLVLRVVVSLSQFWYLLRLLHWVIYLRILNTQVILNFEFIHSC